LCFCICAPKHNIGHIRCYLTSNVSKSLVNGLIRSHLDYCNDLLNGLRQTSINKLQRIQNTTAWIIIRTRIQCNLKSQCTPIKPYMNRLQNTYLTCWQFINQKEHYIRLVQWHWWFQGLEHLAMVKENYSVQQPSYGMHSQLTFVNRKYLTLLRSCWKRICSRAILVFNFFFS